MHGWFFHRPAPLNAQRGDRTRRPDNDPKYAIAFATILMNSTPKRFPARMAALDDVLTHVATICRQAGLVGDGKIKATLIIEELFINTVRHGYRQDGEQPVWISAHGDHHSLHLIYQDEAPPFNPLNLPIDQPPADLGGWGIKLIANLANNRYHYENGRNTLTLTFKTKSD